MNYLSGMPRFLQNESLSVFFSISMLGFFYLEFYILNYFFKTVLRLFSRIVLMMESIFVCFNAQNTITNYTKEKCLNGLASITTLASVNWNVCQKEDGFLLHLKKKLLMEHLVIRIQTTFVLMVHAYQLVVTCNSTQMQQLIIAVCVMEMVVPVDSF